MRVRNYEIHLETLCILWGSFDFDYIGCRLFESLMKSLKKSCAASKSLIRSVNQSCEVDSTHCAAGVFDVAAYGEHGEHSHDPYGGPGGGATLLLCEPEGHPAHDDQGGCGDVDLIQVLAGQPREVQLGLQNVVCQGSVLGWNHTPYLKTFLFPSIFSILKGSA